MDSNFTSRLVEDIENRPRYYALLTLITTAFIIAVWWAFIYLTTGTITVNTQKDNKVTISYSNGKSTDKISEDTKVGFRLKAGDYTLNVTSVQGSIKQKFNIKVRKHLELTINPERPSSIEPVMPAGAYSLASDGLNTYYLDYLTYKLNKVGTNGVPSEVANSPNFTGSIKWNGPSFGIGLSTARNSMYTITNGAIAPLQTPFADLTDLKYSLSSDGAIYIANKDKLYKREKGDVDFKEIDISDARVGDIGSIDAGSSRIILRTRVPENQSEEESASKLFLLSADGKLVKRVDDMANYEEQWSQTGKYFAASGDSGSSVYDSNLDLIAKLPDVNTVAITWLNDDSLLYAQGSDIYSYQVSDSRSTSIASAPLGSGISGLYVDSKNTVVYIETEKNTSSDTTRQLGRVHTSSDQTPGYLYGLSAFFPATYRTCDFSFYNFTKPVITYIQNSADADCVRLAQVELKQDNLPVDSFSIEPAPSINQDGE